MKKLGLWDLIFEMKWMMGNNLFVFELMSKKCFND